MNQSLSLERNERFPAYFQIKPLVRKENSYIQRKRPVRKNNITNNNNLELESSAETLDGFMLI